MTRIIPTTTYTSRVYPWYNCMDVIITWLWDDTVNWQDSKLWWDNWSAWTWYTGRTVPTTTYTGRTVPTTSYT
jgi:hypothetical protein